MSMDDEVDEVVAEFLMESHENLDQLDNDFIALEERPHDKALLASVFRTIHTIKGTCGFLGFGHLESLTHAGEHLLSQLRTGALTLDGPRTSALLAMVDAVRQMMRLIEASGTDGDAPSAALIGELERLSHPDPTPAAAAVEPGRESQPEIEPEIAPEHRTGDRTRARPRGGPRAAGRHARRDRRGGAGEAGEDAQGTRRRRRLRRRPRRRP